MFYMFFLFEEKMVEVEQKNKQIINEKQVKRILSKYSSYTPISNKFCVDIPIAQNEGKDSKMTIKQFYELARFYTHYHMFQTSKKEFMEKQPQDMSVFEKNNQWLKAEKKMLEDYAAKAKVKVYPVYKKQNIFKGFENIFTEEINNHLKDAVSNLKPENIIPINDLKNKYVKEEKNKRPVAHIQINADTDTQKEISYSMFIFKKYSRALYIYKRIMKNEEYANIINTATSQGKKETLKAFNEIIEKYLNQDINQTDNKPQEGQFPSLSVKAFQTLKDMKPEIEQNIILNIPDSLFKFNVDIKKMYKLQKIYYYDIFIKDILNILNERYHIITSYINAKKFEKTEKKVITENKFIEKPKINIVSVLNIEFVEVKKPIKNNDNKQNEQENQNEEPQMNTEDELISDE